MKENESLERNVLCFLDVSCRENGGINGWSFLVKFPVLSLASTAINKTLKFEAKAKAENSVSECKAKAKAFKSWPRGRSRGLQQCHMLGKSVMIVHVG